MVIKYYFVRFNNYRVRKIPIKFKNLNFIIRLISSDINQIKNQTKARHKKSSGLYDIKMIDKSCEIIMKRDLLQ